MIDLLPIGYPERKDLIEALNKSVSALLAEENTTHALEGNSAPISPSLLLAYVLARGVRLDVLARSYTSVAEHTWQIVSTKAPGERDQGAWLLARSEADQLPMQQLGQGKTVMMDAWFSARMRPNAAGGEELFGYKWSDEADSGFSFVGHALRRYGLELDELRAAPTAANLESAQIYFLVSPDTPAINPHAHAMDARSADAIEAWVKAGGVLVLLINRESSAETTHINLLGERFGMRFNDAGTLRAEGKTKQLGRVILLSGMGIVMREHQAFLKDAGTIKVSGVAHPLVKQDEEVLFAEAAAGRGVVLAVSDTWLANEFTDGRKLPPDSDNYAAIDLVQWLLRQTQ